ncbi:hypothetical protein JCM10908_002025 [Rhodotorula pacifica]|uniref:uncharacterized protein n=1 Tax=Rhodotorula pacifica TaxID=1495444 RepID=UPI00317CC79E
MLAAPPIHAPLKRPAYPPPAASATSPAPLPRTANSTEPAPRPRQRGDPHRHAQAIREALNEAQRLADQIDEALAVTELATQRDEGIGINASLEKKGWIHHTTTSGVRMFHLAAQPPAEARLDRSKPAKSLARSNTSSHPNTRGVRADESLPYFRGEGWIEGSWKRDDVAATIVSLDARSIWDPRFERARSQVIEHLSETDSLYHLHLKSNLVSDRDLCVVTSSVADDRPDKSNVSYVVSASVVDLLIPPSSTTTTIHLNAFALRSLSRPPHYEPPPLLSSPSSRTRQMNGSPPIRPAHRRTRSTASALHTTSSLMGTIPLPPVPLQDGETPETPAGPSRPRLVSAQTHVGHPQPPPLLHTLSNYTSATSSYGYTGSISPSDVAGPYPPMHVFGQGAGQLALQKKAGPAPPISTGPGLAVSMVIHASPGYNLPQTTIDQLSVLLPLNIAAISRYLGTHGFAPYISRSCEHLHIREETFDAQSGKYRVVFTTSAEARAKRDHQACIRFFGGSFGRGRFHVEVQHVDPKAWTLDWDIPPRPEDVNRFDLRREAEEVGSEGSGLWRSKVSLRRPGEDDRPRPERRTSSNSLFSPVERDDPSARDPALQPGPLGGCTVYIPTSATQPSLPVVVTVERTTTVSAMLPLARRQGVSNALAQAAQVALDDHLSLCSSVEELLECGEEGSEARAEVCLKGTRMVLRELETAQAREEANANAATAAAAFAARKNALRSPLSRSTILLRDPIPRSRSSDAGTNATARAELAE